MTIAETTIRNAHPAAEGSAGIEEFPNLIAGERIASASGRLFANTNPADNSDLVGRFQESTAADAQAAVDAAVAAFDGWRRTPITKRAAILNRAADHLEARADHIAQAGRPVRLTHSAGVDADVEHASTCLLRLPQHIVDGRTAILGEVAGVAIARRDEEAAVVERL